MSFDNESELHKVKKYFPTARSVKCALYFTDFHDILCMIIFQTRLVLRIRADAPDCVGQPGYKFGCSVSGGKELLNTAMKLGLNVVGVR